MRFFQIIINVRRDFASHKKEAATNLEILHGCTNIASNRHVLQGHNKISTSNLASWALKIKF